MLGQLKSASRALEDPSTIGPAIWFSGAVGTRDCAMILTSSDALPVL